MIIASVEKFNISPPPFTDLSDTDWLADFCKMAHCRHYYLKTVTQEQNYRSMFDAWNDAYTEILDRVLDKEPLDNTTDSLERLEAQIRRDELYLDFLCEVYGASAAS